MTQRLYDDNNRIICETLANGLSLEYSYDALNRPLQITLPDATHIVYTYTAGHLKTVSRNGYEHQYSSYDLSGVLLEENTPIGKISYSWDLLNRPCTIESTYFSETIPEIGYDAVGNLLHKSRQDPERLTHCMYSYDSLYQLKSETITGFDAHEYTYDSLYNRRLRDNKEHTVNHLNQLLQLEETTYTYDKRGNLIAQDSPTDHSEYTYDALGRLTTLCRNGNEYTYQYDAFNRRIAKHSPRSVERYLYIDQNEIGMVDERGKIVQLRILGRGKGAEIGAAVALELENRIYIPIHDHCGHVSVLIDLQAKQFAEGYVYSAFGEQQRYGSGTTNPWHFSSKRYDPESGWVYFGRRYYDPATGRWTTPDPIGFADGPNLYAYVKNNPLTHFDAYGLYETGTGNSSLYETNQAHRSQHRETRRSSGSEAGARKGEFFNSVSAACTRACREFATNAYYDIQTSLSINSLSLDRVLHNIEESEQFRVNNLSTIRQQVESDYGVNPNDRSYRFTNCLVGWGLTIGALFTPAVGQEKAAATFTAKILPRAVRGIDKVVRVARRIFGKEEQGVKDVCNPSSEQINVTPDGVALPAQSKYQIPRNYVENPHRSGSYGEYINGKFVEKLRIDPATPPGMKGPNNSHYHLDGKGTHYSPEPGMKNPGFFHEFL